MQHEKDILSPGCNFMCVFMVGTLPWVSPCTHIHMYMYLSSCSPPRVPFASVLCVYDDSLWFFPGCSGGEGREEGREEGEFGEGSGRKEEAMCVGESTTATVHEARS